MGSFITDLKNSFNRGNIYIQFIYINVGVFVLTSLLGILWMLFNRNGAFILQYLELPAWTVQFIKQPWSLFTYMFMHGGFQHIFFNMFALWMFGRTLEQVWGPKRFLSYYMVCGIGAGLVQELVQYIQYVTELSQYDSVNTGIAVIPMAEYLNLMTTVGASGAIYGILLAFGMLFPNSQMFVFPIPFPVKAKYFVMGYAALEIFLGLGASTDGVAHFAHLGGMIFGFILIMYWRKKNNNGQFYY